MPELRAGQTHLREAQSLAPERNADRPPFRGSEGGTRGSALARPTFRGSRSDEANAAQSLPARGEMRAA